ncbi:MAG: tRNA pseudouridine(38-40) synthase TruA [Chlamydiales bacterium]|nr:tRNA pseudouridine(38-40) synthase TruA [Chlamydiales bacterium]
MIPLLYNYKCLLSYKGTNYVGWQKNPFGDTIEERLEKALFQLLKEKISLQAASRTDAGVHAEGQVIQFTTSSSLEDTNGCLSFLNAHLPCDIRLLSLEQVPSHFHPTLDAIGKEYRYAICNAPFQLPFHQDFSWHFPYPLDIDAMKEASQSLLGSHDFSTFCNERPLWTRNPICSLSSILINKQEENRLFISIYGNHFLYKMVRNLVGTLLYVGCKKISKHSIPSILAEQRRPSAGVTAPAHGLTLKTVFYN